MQKEIAKTVRQIKVRINRYIRKILEFEEDFYKPVTVGNF